MVRKIKCNKYKTENYNIDEQELKYLNAIYDERIKKLKKNPVTKTLEQIMKECGDY